MSIEPEKVKISRVLSATWGCYFIRLTRNVGQANKLHPENTTRYGVLIQHVLTRHKAVTSYWSPKGADVVTDKDIYRAFASIIYTAFIGSMTLREFATTQGLNIREPDTKLRHDMCKEAYRNMYKVVHIGDMKSLFVELQTAGV